MKTVIAALALTLAAGSTASTTSVPLRMWRLDCGSFDIENLAPVFSDAFDYKAAPLKIANSCYLVRHGSDFFLWDTGLTEELVGQSYKMPGQTLSVRRSIIDQLREIGVRADQVGMIGISHYHNDHTGQARAFPHAKLFIGKEDFEALKQGADPLIKRAQDDLAHWLRGGGSVETVTKDLDVFSDGAVVMLSTPGHTPGHHSLLVRLASGPVLLTGDIYQLRSQRLKHIVSSNSTNRADTLASMDRFDRIAANMAAKVVIQHDPADIARLPAFPKAAE